MLSLISSHVPEAEKRMSSLSSLDYTKIKQDNTRQIAQAVLSGLPKDATSGVSLFPTDLLYRYLDAKVASPRIVRNYLQKVEEAIGKTDSRPERLNINFKGIVDEVLEKSMLENEKAEEPGEQVVTDTDVEDAVQQNNLEFFGIVGEIFDKYA